MSGNYKYTKVICKYTKVINCYTTPYMGHLMADLLILIGHIYISWSHISEKKIMNNLKPLHGKLVAMTSLGEEEGGEFSCHMIVKKD